MSKRRLPVLGKFQLLRFVKFPIVRLGRVYDSGEECHECAEWEYVGAILSGTFG